MQIRDHHSMEVMLKYTQVLLTLISEEWAWPEFMILILMMVLVTFRIPMRTIFTLHLINIDKREEKDGDYNSKEIFTTQTILLKEQEQFLQTQPYQ